MYQAEIKRFVMELESPCATINGITITEDKEIRPEKYDDDDPTFQCARKALFAIVENGVLNMDKIRNLPLIEQYYLYHDILQFSEIKLQYNYYIASLQHGNSVFHFQSKCFTELHD